jgi:hypothetical protein
MQENYCRAVGVAGFFPIDTVTMILVKIPGMAASKGREKVHRHARYIIVVRLIARKPRVVKTTASGAG